MASVKQQIAEHDAVALREATGGWEAGRTGTVVSDYGEIKLVEFADERGAALDYVQVPESGLKLLTRHGH